MKSTHTNIFGKMRILTALLLAVILVFSVGCNKAPDEKSGDIVVLYTSDVHCGADDHIGYAALSAYRNELLQKTSYVTLVDNGDAIQGDALGYFSQGENIIDIMNAVGYDVFVLGNHEFDYGMPQLAKLVDKSDAAVLSCNLQYLGEGENPLKEVKPYEIISYGDVDVAYIGITTPWSFTSSSPKNFQDDKGNFIYSLGSESAETFFAIVQGYIDECREKGAEYVIGLGHLGIEEGAEPFRSYDVIANTTGMDAFLDGHSHTVSPSEYVKNKDGKNVVFSSCGTKLEHIGQLIITEDGLITTGLVESYPDKDDSITAVIENCKAGYEETLTEKIGETTVRLSTDTVDGVRLVRNRETNLGDLCADAYRMAGDADIAFSNGGGIRKSIEIGDITYGSIFGVFPFGNTICTVETTGQEILDCLEAAYRRVEKENVDESGNPIGEYGGFQQVSGIRFTVDTSVPSSVVLDENNMFIEVAGPYRVKDVEVLQKDGSYAPLDLEKTYVLASHSYLIKAGGDGIGIFMDNKLLVTDGITDQQALTDYIQNILDGVVGEEYKEPAGRITIK